VENPSRKYFARVLCDTISTNKRKRQEMPTSLLQRFRDEARRSEKSDSTDRNNKREFYLRHPDQIPLDSFSESQVRALARRALHQIIRTGGTLGLGD
jgi:hypothetical protein